MTDVTGTAQTEELRRSPMDDEGLWDKLKRMFAASAKAQRTAKKSNEYGNMGNQAGGSRAYSDASKALDEENNP